MTFLQKLFSFLVRRNSRKNHTLNIPYFQFLPSEMQYHIFSFLDAKDLLECTRVNKEWNVIANDETFWNRFFVKISRVNEPPSPKVCHSSVVFKGRLYVYGGHVPDAQNYIRDVKNDFYRYDFVTHRWESVPSKSEWTLPLKTEHSAVLYKTSMFIFGGYSGGLGYRDSNLYEYNLLTKHWSKIEPQGEIPRDRSAHTAVVYRDHMYILGGWDGMDSNKDLYKYSFETREWSRVLQSGNVPPNIRSHAAVVYKDQMIVCGGYGNEGHPESVYIFYFEKGEWVEIDGKEGFRPRGRSRFKAVVFNDSLWCYGGWDRKAYFHDLWRFDLITHKWHKIETYTNKLSNLGQHSMVIHNGIMYIYGGYSPEMKSPHNNLFAYKFPKRIPQLAS